MIDHLTKISLIVNNRLTEKEGLYLLSSLSSEAVPMLVSCTDGVYMLHRDGKQYIMNRQTAIKLARLSVAYWWQGNPEGKWEYAQPKPFSRFNGGVQ